MPTTSLCRSCYYCHAYRRDGREMVTTCRMTNQVAPPDIVWCNAYRLSKGGQTDTYPVFNDSLIIDPRESGIDKQYL